MTRGHAAITLGRKELIAKLAAISNRLSANSPDDKSVRRIANFVTECGMEFDLSNDEQILFLKFIVSGKTTSEELLKGVD